MNPLLFAFYGDDFTGSADAMEALTINGVRTALFLGHPSQERLQEKLGELDAGQEGARIIQEKFFSRGKS